tara:strand:+ start:659 stop:1678 length:1020 start_codon:yes stop_codon:yes gene_type:complete
MPAHSSRIFIDGEQVDYLSGTLTKEGGNTASRLNFTLPGKDVSLRKYWGKEVTFFLDKSDAYPMFRGFIENLELLDNSSLSCRALDAMGYLTGLDRSAVTLDEFNNVDGATIGGALKEMISMANLSNVGTDFIGDTDPITRIGRLRGKLHILDTITQQLSNIYNTNHLRNFLKVIDDGTQGQLVINTEVNAENETSIHTFSYDDNMINFNVQDRKIPTIITVEGGNDARITFKHNSAMEAFGENSFSVTNNDLTSRADCYDFAQEIFLANLKAKYEYSLSSVNGYYLEENDVVRIIDDSSLVNGKFRIIGKTIQFGNGQLSLDLTINKQPPLLSRFLTT